MMTGRGMRSFILAIGVTAQALLLCACSGRDQPPASVATPAEAPMYQIGAGDGLTIFVWRSPEFTTSVTVRPDGRISVPLINDLYVEGKTPSEVSEEIQAKLAEYIQDPLVTVMVAGFVGTFPQQVRIVGEATAPRAVPYRANMTVLDLLIMAGGLTKFAAGNDATLVRIQDGTQKEFQVHLADLLQNGDISANFPLLPGDILIVPQTFF